MVKEADKTVVTEKERVAKGAILARIVIEVLGAPKEHVEEAIKIVVDRAHRIKDAEVISETTYEAEEKDKLFSTFSELDIWFKDIDLLTRFLFDFTPSSVEIMQPDKISLPAQHFSGFFNDFLLKIHDSGMKLKNISAKMQLLNKNSDTMIRNFLNFALKEPKTQEELSAITGIPKDNILALLENFKNAGIIELKGDSYVLLKNANNKT